MKKIYYKGIEVRIGYSLNYNGLEVKITEELIKLNPKFFKVVEEPIISILEVHRIIIFKELFG